MPTIYLRHGNTHVAMLETPYDAEKVLQKLIERHPEMLVGDEDARGPLVLVQREVGINDEEETDAHEAR